MGNVVMLPLYVSLPPLHDWNPDEFENRQLGQFKQPIRLKVSSQIILRVKE